MFVNLTTVFAMFRVWLILVNMSNKQYFPYRGFYVYDDSSDAEEYLMNCCQNVTLSDYNNIACNSDLFTVMHANCRSILNKDTDVQALLSSVNSHPHVCMFSETWLTSNTLAPRFADYAGHHVVREGRGGGVSIYVRQDVQCQSVRCRKFVSFEYIALVIQISELMKALSLCVYRPPNADINVFFDELEVLLDSLSTDYPDIDKLIIGGDYNINLLDGAKHVGLFMDLLISHSLYPSIFKPTRPGSNALLDNIFLSWPCMVESFILMYDVSDHLPIIARLCAKSMPSSLKSKEKYVRVHSDANVSLFRNNLSACNWDSVYNAMDVNVAYDAFHKSVVSAYVSAFPLTPCCSDGKVKFNKPWMTPGLLQSAKSRSRLYRDCLKGKVSKAVYNRYRNLFVSLSRCAKRTYYNVFFEKNQRNVKAVWQHIKSVKSDAKVNPSCANVDSLNNFYADLGPNTVIATTANHDYEGYVCRNKHSFVLRETDYNEIICVCSGLKAKLSSGFDCISTKLLHSVIDLLGHQLVHIFNLSFKFGIFPDLFKIAKVVPIFKGGDQSTLLNYRPVSLLPAVSKILERLMYNRMMSFADKYSLLTRWQFGFRPYKSTQDAIARFVDNVTSNLDEHRDVCALFVDVAKAFDSLNHEVLLHKLFAYGFRGNCHTWLSSYLHARMQYVEIDGHKSGLRLLATGVPQGSILGPLLFLFYINDLTNSSPDIRFILFADDTTCLCSPEKLQNTCDVVSKWFACNRLCLNLSKTKHMLFTLRNVVPPVVTLMGRNVECVNNYKFLGCFLDSKLSWQTHIDNTCRKISQGIALLRHCNLYPVWVKRLLYSAYVYSHICYCLVIWGGAASLHLNRVVVLQKCALRVMLGVGRVEHVMPLAYANNLLLLPELYKFCLAVFMFKGCILGHNADLFTSNGFIRIVSSGNYNTRVCNSNNYSIPYCRTSLRKHSIIHKAVTNWNNLSQMLKLANNLCYLKNELFTYLINSYGVLLDC